MLVWGGELRCSGGAEPCSVEEAPIVRRGGPGPLESRVRHLNEVPDVDNADGTAGVEVAASIEKR